VLKKLKPDLHQDDLSHLLYCAAISNRKAILEYLLEIGANPNDKANGGSSALETALWHMSFGRLDPLDAKRLKPKYQLSGVLDCLRVLLENGAVWNPDDAYHVNSLRKTLLECEPDVTIELLQMFRRYNACPAERVHKLLGTPRMEEHLRGQASALSRLGINLDVRSRDGRNRRASRSQLSRS
jgi:hypothetical protein